MNELRFKDIRIDLDQKLCYVGESLINLTKIEYELLLFLLEHRNKIFSRQELLNEVWKSKVTLRTVDTTVSRLRKKLGKFGNYIVTRLGFGYGFVEN